jgi:hypothetical protein
MLFYNKERISNDIDKKYIFKDSMEMRMDIKDVRENCSAPVNSAGNNVKHTMQTRTSLRKESMDCTTD